MSRSSDITWCNCMYSRYRHTKWVTFSIVYQAFFARFIIIRQQRNIQLLSVFQYELSPVQHSKVDEFWYLLGGGPRVVVSTAAFHEFVVRFPVSAVWKKQRCFFPIHFWNSVLWEASVTERWRARPQTYRVWISNPVSGGQCCLTHLSHHVIVDHMYGERQEQRQTLRAVARHASQVVKSSKVQLSLSSLLNRHMQD